MIAKPILVAAGVLVVGVVGYKIVQKKNPKLLTDIKDSVYNARKSVGEFFNGVAESFREGYASAAA